MFRAKLTYFSQEKMDCLHMFPLLICYHMLSPKNGQYIFSFLKNCHGKYNLNPVPERLLKLPSEWLTLLLEIGVTSKNFLLHLKCWRVQGT